MTETITEIDMNKYHVMKKDDIEKFLTEGQKIQLSLINTSIRFGRIEEDKHEWPNHLVLNMDDEIDITWLSSILTDKDNTITRKVFVKDIAVDLVNAILKAKRG